MSFSGGVYTLPGPALSTGEIVSATENNQFRNDVATAFNLTFLRNGTSTATANLPMGGYKLTGLGAATTSGDALSYGAAANVTTITISSDATLSGGTANGVAYLSGSKVLTTGSALTFDGTNIGVGTASPVANSGYAGATFNATNGGLLQFQNNGTNKLRLFCSGTQSVIDTGAGVLNILPTGDLTLGTQSTNVIFSNGAVGELARFTSTGLGIGTSSPSAKLSVTSTASRVMQIDSTNANGFGVAFSNSGTDVAYLGSNKWNLGGNLNDISLVVPGANNLIFGTNNTARITIDSSGNLGLGVTPPSGSTTAGFFVSNADNVIGSASNGVTFGSNAHRNSGSWKYTTSSYASLFQQYNGAFTFYTAPSGTAGNAITFTQAMTLDASGKLSVGTTSNDAYGVSVGSVVQPAKVQVASNVNSDLLGLYKNGYTGRYLAAYYNASTSGSASTGSFIGSIETDGTNFQLIAQNAQTFTTNGSERMRIDSSGNVGIGTSSPGATLDVQAATGSMRVRSTTAGNSAYMWASNNGGEFYLGKDDSTGGIFGSGAAYTSCLYSNNAYPMAFFTNGSERMRLTASGNLLVGKTSATSNGGVIQTSNGITFPATQSACSDANTLDDYEEGTWTPNVGGNATYTTQSGNYTKVGRLVTASFEIQINVLGTGSTLSVSGLPFVSGSVNNGQGGSVGYFSSGANSIYFMTFRLDVSSSTIGLATLTAAGGIMNTSTAFFGNGTRLLGSITYMSA